MTSGGVTDHPAALLARAGGLLAAARELADVVLIDAAPVLAANDATDLVPYVDAVVLVARCGRTTRDHALRTTELLARLSVPIAGTVLIGSNMNASAGRYASGSRLQFGWLPVGRRQSAEPVRNWLATAAATARRRGPRHKTGGRSSGESTVWTGAAETSSDGTGWPGSGTRSGPTASASATPAVTAHEDQ